ncbi:MAG: 4'-phosphopantetheinyl transferase superfamily protein [Sulfitobacter sp.]|nr:4'-phosphopantetheinyl transferase superfamily protein [Sulfitobacter sp.]
MDGHSPSRTAQMQAVVESLFEGGIVVAATDPRRPQPDPFEGEDAHLQRAFPSRKREFAAGRAMARAALEALGLEPQIIPAGADRAPLWPEGVTGSISHTASMCVAVASDRATALGVDIEENTDLEADIVASICTEAEIARLTGPDLLRLAKLVFCAKEAAYKAQYPLTGEMMEFSDFDVTFDYRALSFTATFTRQVGQFAVGDVLPGRFGHAADHLVAAVSLGQAA